jgi:AcrR family transcriptional regulator
MSGDARQDAGPAPTGAEVEQQSGGRRSGRRPGECSTRDGILEAARASFAERGYDRATIRDIAARAKVDPALVIHYFGSKEALFTEALQLPLQPGEVFARGMAAGPDHLGATVVRTFLESWEPPERRVRLLAMLRSALTNEAAMGMIRDLLVREVFGPITQALGVPDAQLRATLVGSQFIGLSAMRYIGHIEPLASATVDELVAAIGPTVQRYLAGDLGLAEAGTASAGPAGAGGPNAELAVARTASVAANDAGTAAAGAAQM